MEWFAEHCSSKLSEKFSRKKKYARKTKLCQSGMVGGIFKKLYQCALSRGIWSVAASPAWAGRRSVVSRSRQHGCNVVDCYALCLIACFESVYDIHARLIDGIASHYKHIRRTCVRLFVQNNKTVYLFTVIMITTTTTNTQTYQQCFIDFLFQIGGVTIV